ncbi:hypothetical protein TNIN_119901 [Trichonephila inaurata madagascariensis]|uniref:Uncharacterized protein n=1 Tax=Trichonephila inaurata madagascariensis TaxID=2747483 RepID=A0A8X7BX89_9ARAC|nr:hypothetical protein TNIN_119901 [Trichonephila inaurata madagascariensis]
MLPVTTNSVSALSSFPELVRTHTYLPLSLISALRRIRVPPTISRLCPKRTGATETELSFRYQRYVGKGNAWPAQGSWTVSPLCTRILEAVWVIRGGTCP